MRFCPCRSLERCCALACWLGEWGTLAELLAGPHRVAEAYSVAIKTASAGSKTQRRATQVRGRMGRHRGEGGSGKDAEESDAGEMGGEGACSGVSWACV